MAFQFAHVSTYSIKTGGAGVAGEAGRIPHYCPHVFEPQPPVLLEGLQPDAAWREIERRVAATRVRVVVKGVERERALRSDENVMLAAVVSYPTTTRDVMSDEEEKAKLNLWIKDALEFLEKNHGKALSAVLHLDEKFPHIHFITAPDLENGARMASVHPGEAAKAAAGGREGKKTDKDHAYKEAMRAYQDDYFQSVAMQFGQARTGPGRRRLSRNEWLAEQNALELYAQQHAEQNERERALRARERELESVAASAYEMQIMLAEKQQLLQKQAKELDHDARDFAIEKKKISDDINDLEYRNELLVSYNSEYALQINELEKKAGRVQELEDRLAAAQDALENEDPVLALAVLDDAWIDYSQSQRIEN